MQFGKCSDTVYNYINITLPLSYSNTSYCVVNSTRDDSNAVCNRTLIKDINVVYFSRSGGYNVTGWYCTIGY